MAKKRVKKRYSRKKAAKKSRSALSLFAARKRWPRKKRKDAALFRAFAWLVIVDMFLSVLLLAIQNSAPSVLASFAAFFGLFVFVMSIVALVVVNKHKLPPFTRVLPAYILLSVILVFALAFQEGIQQNAAGVENIIIPLWLSVVNLVAVIIAFALAVWSLHKSH